MLAPEDAYGHAQFLSSLREEATGSGALLIFDEIRFASFGAADRNYWVSSRILRRSAILRRRIALRLLRRAAEHHELFDPREPARFRTQARSTTYFDHGGGTAAVPLLSAAALELLNRRGDGLREPALAVRAHRRTVTVTGLGSLMTIHPTGGRNLRCCCESYCFSISRRRVLSALAA